MAATLGAENPEAAKDAITAGGSGVAGATVLAIAAAASAGGTGAKLTKEELPPREAGAAPARAAPENNAELAAASTMSLENFFI
jgi:hypothetical protein